MAEKSDQATIMLRVNQVRTWLLDGNNRAKIVQDGSKKWGISERQVDDYLAAARNLLKDELEEMREASLAEHIALRRNLRTRARKAKDLRVELDTLKDEAKLLNIYPAEKHEHTGHLTWEQIMHGTTDGSAVPDDNNDPFA